MNPAQASSNATLLVSMMITRSLRRIGMSRSVRMSAVSLSDGLGQTEQLRVNLQPGAVGRHGIDLKAHTATFHQKIDCAPAVQKIRRVADGQDRALAQL